MALAAEWSFTRKLALTIVMMALAIALSPIHIPIGPTKAFPWQHMTNVILGVILGPIWAPAAAVVISVIRMMLGVGTIFSIPGGVPGAFLVGLGAVLLKRAGKPPEYAAALEPLGTAVIGFLLALYVFAPLVGVYEDWLARGLIAIWLVWLASTLVGTVVGYLSLRVLRRTGLI